MLNALLETIGTLGVVVSILAKLLACFPKRRHRSRATRQP